MEKFRSSGEIFIASLLSYFWTRIPPLVLNFSFKIIFHPRQCQIKSILILSPSKGKGPADATPYECAMTVEEQKDLRWASGGVSVAIRITSVGLPRPKLLTSRASLLDVARRSSCTGSQPNWSPSLMHFSPLELIWASSNSQFLMLPIKIFLFKIFF